MHGQNHIKLECASSENMCTIPADCNNSRGSGSEGDFVLSDVLSSVEFLIREQEIFTRRLYLQWQKLHF